MNREPPSRFTILLHSKSRLANSMISLENHYDNAIYMVFGDFHFGSVQTPIAISLIVVPLIHHNRG